MEIEALEAILMDDLEVVEESQWPSGWKVPKCWRVVIVPTEDGVPIDSGQDTLRMELVFAHTPNYPDAAPMYKPRSLRGLSDADLAQLSGVLAGVVEENLGMAMVYNLVTAAQEWLMDKVGAASEEKLSPEEMKQREREEEERRLAEMRRYGTPVTPENFRAWLDKYRAEQALEKARLAEAAPEKKGRFTGRQWFAQQEQAGAEVLEEPDDDDAEFQEELRREAELRAAAAARAGPDDDDEDEEEDEDFDEDDEDDDDEDEMLEQYLAQKQ